MQGLKEKEFTIDEQEGSKIAEVIKAWRHVRHLSVTELAVRAGFSEKGRSYISKIEHGQVKRLGDENLSKIAQALGLSRADLVLYRMPSEALPENTEGNALHSMEKEPQIGKLLLEISAIKRTRHLPRVRTEFHGLEDVLHAIIQLIRAAETVPIEQITSNEQATSNNRSSIRITFQGERGVFASAPDLREEWLDALRVALEYGWDIIHLVNPNEHVQRMITMVEGALKLLGTRGNYEPRYSTHDMGAISSARDFIIVPGVGALELYASQQDEFVNLAVFSPPGEHMQDLIDYFDLLKRRSKLLLKSYEPCSLEDEKAFEYDKALTQCYKSEGDRFLVIDGLSEVTAPLWIHEKRATRVQPEDEKKARLLLGQRKQRIDAFREQVERGVYHFFDICTQRAVRCLVEEGIYAPDDWFASKGIVEERDERKEHIKSILALLDNPNYELALLDDTELEICRTSWLIKGDHTLLLETWHPITRTNTIQEDSQRDETPPGEIDLIIQEPTLVQAFRSHFLSIWKNIPSQNKSKVAIRKWLEGQLKQIENAK